MGYREIILAVCLLYFNGCFGYDQLGSFSDTLLREVMNRMEDGREFTNDFDLPALEDYSSPQITFRQNDDPEHNAAHPKMSKEFARNVYLTMNDDILDHEPSLRDQEYLQHSSLFGHQYMQGGAGEGYQRLKPDGSMKNMQIIKSDGILPSYCNPPNPCPLGYTAEDGCLEDFVNTAAFSSEYQASQKCMCDTEHMFDCPGASRENEIDALARSIQNEGLIDTTLDRIVQNMQIDGEHKNLVAKKFFSHKSLNPYLQGDKLPVVAKKTPRK